MTPPITQTLDINGPRSTCSSPGESIRIYTIEPHTFLGFLNRTRDWRNAHKKWQEFWATTYKDPELLVQMTANNFADKYRELRKAKTGRSGAKCQSDAKKTRSSGILSSLARPNIYELSLPGGAFELMKGIDTGSFSAFDDEGVAFKDINSKDVDAFFPPLPVMMR